jgi:hypothetical protein
MAVDTFLRYSGGALVVVDGVIQIGPAPDTSALVLEYLFGANGSESTITLDTSGNNYTGTVSGVTWLDYTNGLSAHYEFTGGGVQITRTSEPSASARTNFSLIGMVRRDRSATIEYLYRDSAVALYFDASDRLRYQLDDGSGFGTGADFTAPVDNAWHSFMLTHERGVGQKLYWDGSQVGSESVKTNVLASAGASLYLGANSGANPLDGGLDAIQMYSEVIASNTYTATNLTQNVQLGILSEWVSDNAYDDCVLWWDGSAIYTDGSASNQTLSTASAPVMGGTTNLGWGDFNGSANVITSTDAGFPSGSAARTVVCWFKHDADAVDIVWDYGTANPNQRFAIYYDSGDSTFKTLIGSYGTEFSHTRDSSWHHLAVVHTNGNNVSQLACYLDGVAQSTSLYSSDFALNTVLSGTAYFGAGSTGSNWDGRISKYGVFDFAFSSNQVYSLYTSQTNLFAGL